MEPRNLKIVPAPEPAQPSRTVTWIVRGALLLSPLWLTLFAEAGLRLHYWINFSVPGHTYGIYKYDKALGSVHRGHSYNMNAYMNDWGFRNSEDVIEPKPAGALRILSYGGSTTYCYNLSNAEAWPTRLQDLLRKNRPGGSRDQVLNGGVITWSLGHLLEKARRDIPALKPDYVLIFSGVNELMNAVGLAEDGRSIEDLVKRKEFGAWTLQTDQNSWLVRNSLLFKVARTYLFNPIRERMYAFRRQMPSGEPKDITPYVMENYLATLRNFIELAKQNGAQPIFLREVGKDLGENRGQILAFSTAGAKFAADLGVKVVDATDIIEKYPGDRSSLFIATGVHFTNSGAELFSKYVYDNVFVGVK